MRVRGEGEGEGEGESAIELFDDALQRSAQFSLNAQGLELRAWSSGLGAQISGLGDC